MTGNNFSHNISSTLKIEPPGFLYVDHIAISVCTGELEKHVKIYKQIGFKEIHREEIRVIHTIAGYLNINNKDYESIKAIFIKDMDSAYKILEIDSSASDGEVKKAYRKMAVKYHPDKVAHLGKEIQRTAEEKFKAVSDAYNEIKKQRNIS